MVQEIKAYQAADGSIHATRVEAARHEAEQAIAPLLDNTVAVRLVLEHAKEIFEALGPMVVVPDDNSIVFNKGTTTSLTSLILFIPSSCC